MTVVAVVVVVFVVFECAFWGFAYLNHGWEDGFDVLRYGLGVGFVEEVVEA